MSSTDAHLWAVGYEEVRHARQVREELYDLAGQTSLVLLDALIVIRHADGSYAFDRQERHSGSSVAGTGVLSGLVGLILAVPPLSADAFGAWLGSAGLSDPTAPLIDDEFIEQVEALMSAGTCALFVLDDPVNVDIDVIGARLHGLGGTVLKTNVNLARAQLVQSLLSSPPPGHLPQHSTNRRPEETPQATRVEP